MHTQMRHDLPISGSKQFKQWTVPSNYQETRTPETPQQVGAVPEKCSRLPRYMDPPVPAKDRPANIRGQISNFRRQKGLQRPLTPVMSNLATTSPPRNNTFSQKETGSQQKASANVFASDNQQNQSKLTLQSPKKAFEPVQSKLEDVRHSTSKPGQIICSSSSSMTSLNSMTLAMNPDMVPQLGHEDLLRLVKRLQDKLKKKKEKEDKWQKERSFLLEMLGDVFKISQYLHRVAFLHVLHPDVDGRPDHFAKIEDSPKTTAPPRHDNFVHEDCKIYQDTQQGNFETEDDFSGSSQDSKNMLNIPRTNSADWQNGPGGDWEKSRTRTIANNPAANLPMPPDNATNCEAEEEPENFQTQEGAERYEQISSILHRFLLKAGPELQQLMNTKQH